MRLIDIALALTTIAIGLLVHEQGAAFGPVARDVLSDALWAVMIVWWVGALVPAARLVVRSGAAYAICAGVEVSQRYHTPALDAIRATSVGQLVLGSGLSARPRVVRVGCRRRGAARGHRRRQAKKTRCHNHEGRRLHSLGPARRAT